ncbi:MAG: ATP-binding protein [Candidatus Omnitrophica bacterium]|nr:ATP-binding protein [Candidatus Omnitrophota bacterium]MBU4479742.1 ATP-binding protein [Candidatus Omnitrophota bacterium]
MYKNEILSILKDWNDWEGRQDIGILRSVYLNRLEGLITGSNQIITITGPRRAGKSYLMRQMARRLSEKGVRRENILFVNFEDPRFTSLDTKLLAQIYDVYKGFLSPTDTPFIFLDEVQEVSEWEKWVRTMHELKKAKIIVSGSNAHLLSRELGTLLTGRHLDLTVFPLSFAEYLMFNKVEIKGAFDTVGKEAQIDGFLHRYIEAGSFPEVTLSAKKTEILLNYFDDLLTKDLLKRFRVRKAPAMKALIKYYFSNAANLMSFTSAGKYLQVHTNTVERFSGYFEDVYLIFLLKRFSYKVKEQEKSPRKIYCVDTGLCNSLGFRFSENIGRLAENIVFLALKRKQMLEPQTELFYWKDIQHREVDFVIKEGLKVTSLIQVCWNLRDDKTKARELRSLRKAMKELNISTATIITEAMEGEEKLNGYTVKTVPLWKWLLAEEVALLRVWNI